MPPHRPKRRLGIAGLPTVKRLAGWTARDRVLDGGAWRPGCGPVCSRRPL